ncbi:MAG: tetratricopeptide repeat protein, partial [Acidobacteriales bacterium]|nr:tetratricopeptide repeat protein [Terriglobales bacterium]
MKPSTLRLSLLCALAFGAPIAFAQQTASPQTPAAQAPGSVSPTAQPDRSVPNSLPPDTRAPNSKPSSSTSENDAKTPASSSTAQRADAYYHFALAHMYEEQVALYQRSEYAERAIEEYKLALAADPNNSYLNAGLAELYFHTNRIRDAVTEAQQVIRRDPDNVDARKLLGGIYLQLLGDTKDGGQSQEMLKQAIEQYSAIVRLQPDDFENRILLGRLYMLGKNYVPAEQQFKEVLKRRPANEDALSYLTYLYNEEGDHARAAQLLENIPEGQRSGKLEAALGFTYEQQKQYKQAVDAYRKAVDADPENLDAERSLADNLFNDGQYEAALKEQKKLVGADPQDAATLLRLAEIERRVGQYDAALQHLKKAETLVPDSQEVGYNEAVVYEAQGKPEEAARVLTALLAKTDGKPTLTSGDRNNRSIFLERLGNVYKQQGKTQLAVETY